MPQGQTCSVAGCNKPHEAKGVCNTHYFRLRRTGTVERIVRTLRDRFNDRVMMDPNSGCWIWAGSYSKGGYGSISACGRYGRTLKAHRVSWELHRGEIPGGMFVCHSCDNRACVNPNHLFLGSSLDNMVDCCLKGRKAQKLSPEKVMEIRKRERSAVEYAEQFGVSEFMVYKIWTGERWHHHKARPCKAGN